jgi:hypothetical protein
MLLLGIRAVARNSITILTVGGDEAIGDTQDIPFLLKDANIVYHSEKQERGGISPHNMLRSRLRYGIRYFGSYDVVDLPVFGGVSV